MTVYRPARAHVSPNYLHPLPCTCEYKLYITDMTVAVNISVTAQKDIDGLPAVAKAQVAAVLARLPEYPAVVGIKALKGALKGTYRVRAGSYRVLFTLGKGTLTVTSVDDRKDVYK